MKILFIILGCILGVGIGCLIPTIPYTVSNYLAIAIVAALDSVFGGIASNIRKNFDIKVFVLAAIVVFVGRMFNNLGTIRRYYLSKIDIKKEHKTKEENENIEK